MLRYFFAVLGAVFLSGAQITYADDSLLVDSNEDGVVSALAFGDSITYGIGDGIDPGAFLESIPQGQKGPGYPARLAKYLGIPVTNSGVPGEELTGDGVFRFPRISAASDADIVVILEGANDAVLQKSRGEFARDLQRTINIAVVQGKTPLLGTPPPPCCRREALSAFTDEYDSAIRDLAFINNLRLVDLAHAWSTTCKNPGACELYNVPEGLHPNTLGYDVIAQTAAAAILGIDIFSSGGAKDLEGALDLPAGSVVVLPDPGA